MYVFIYMYNQLHWQALANRGIAKSSFSPVVPVCLFICFFIYFFLYHSPRVVYKNMILQIIAESSGGGNNARLHIFFVVVIVTVAKMTRRIFLHTYIYLFILLHMPFSLTLSFARSLSHTLSIATRRSYYDTQRGRKTKKKCIIYDSGGCASKCNNNNSERNSHARAHAPHLQFFLSLVIKTAARKKHGGVYFFIFFI